MNTRNPYYPRWIKRADGAEQVVDTPKQHAALVGYAVNDDGTPKEQPKPEPQGEAMVEDPLGLFKD